MTETEQLLRAALADAQQQLADASVARINKVVQMAKRIAELEAQIEPKKESE